MTEPSAAMTVPRLTIVAFVIALVSCVGAPLGYLAILAVKQPGASAELRARLSTAVCAGAATVVLSLVLSIVSLVRSRTASRGRGLAQAALVLSLLSPIIEAVSAGFVFLVNESIHF